MRSYTFKVDASDHQEWKNVQYLLTNREAAEDITEIKVQWDRRDVNDESTWTKKWEWTPEERDMLLDLNSSIKPGVTQETIEAILGSVNSEALLPFLLCFTSNLQKLDMGEVLLPLVLPYENDDSLSSSRSCVKVLHNILGEEAEKEELETLEDVKNAFGEDGEDLEDVITQIRRSNLLQGHYPEREFLGLWFYQNLEESGPDKILPGLRSLKHFVHGYDKRGNYPSQEYDGWLVFHLPHILFLPQIESIIVDSCIGGMAPWWDLSYEGPKMDEILEKYKDMKSTAKHLEFSNALVGRGDLVKIAERTNALEKLIIQGQEEHSFLAPEHGKMIVTVLLENNKATLTAKNIDINGLNGEDWLVVDDS
ncbi:hypothetical protein H072_5438 [Dactylellina haptotyla CBS 200.50]|uniref:Uncharacterized protein n=1 Tax=Dactylellina haptotyla (strain CBS 200.50) TaxID=1284197 RepID=S8AHM5_DACHA|nr:hypothetical protein H072_5438 [Dactylellina haptotyla CBS 200.50]